MQDVENPDAAVRHTVQRHEKKSNAIKIGIGIFVVLIVIGAIIGILVGTKVIGASSSSSDGKISDNLSSEGPPDSSTADAIGVGNTTSSTGLVSSSSTGTNPPLSSSSTVTSSSIGSTDPPSSSTAIVSSTAATSSTATNPPPRSSSSSTAINTPSSSSSSTARSSTAVSSSNSSTSVASSSTGITPPPPGGCVVVVPENGGLGSCPKQLNSTKACNYLCDQGYTLVTTTAVGGLTNCTNGVLTAQSCVVSGCQLTLPRNGVLNTCPSSMKLAHGGSCSFKCETGFTVAGAKTQCDMGVLTSQQSCVTTAAVTVPTFTGTNFDSTAPATLTFIDYSGDTPITRGKIAFDSKSPDLIFDHTWLKSSIGAISIVNTGSTAQWGEFEFGGVLIAHNPSLNAEGTNPVYQVLVAGKPYGRWATYPARRTFNRSSDVNHPPPFKVEIRSANNVLLGTMQMMDGLPINSPQLSQVRLDYVPIRPKWHIGQLLKWQNAKTKPNINMRKWIGGFTLDSIRQSQAKIHFSTNPAQNLLGYGSAMRVQNNGINQWYALPKWPLGTCPNMYNTTFDDNSRDPYLYQSGIPYPAWMNSVNGWGYEPGSVGGHDHLTGPGGQRVDRGGIASPYAIYYANQTFQRLKGGEPIRELVEAWGDNYFNHGGYWIRNLTAFTSLPMAEVHDTRWAFLKPYYGSQLPEIPQGDKAAWDYNVELWISEQGGFDRDPLDAHRFYDRDGLTFWNGWGIDGHHSYQFAGYHTLMFSSGAHVFASRQAYTWNKMAWLAQHRISKGDFLYRTHAFRWTHMVMQWILSNPHPSFGINATAIEEIFHFDLATIVDSFKADAVAEKTLSDAAMNRLGSYLGAPDSGPNGTGKLRLSMSSLGYYSTQMWAMMKTSGLWAKLRLNPKSAEGLDFTMEKYDQYCFGKAVYALEKPGWQGPIVGGSYKLPNDLTLDDVPTWQKYAEWYPRNGTEDYAHLPDGKVTTKNEYAASHVEIAYAFMRRDYYPEVQHPLLAQTVKLFQGWMDAVAANVANQTTPGGQKGQDWIYRFPHLGILTPPQ